MIKEFSELFMAFSKVVGMNDNQVNRIFFLILLIGFGVTLLSTLYRLLKKILNFFQTRRINQDLHPFFTPTDVRLATKFFIPTKYQNVSPSEDEEPGRRYIASAKNELMPLFINKVFGYGKSDNKYYLILADSGMGKTTFLINLYIKYKNKLRTIFEMKPYSIKLIPIWHPNAIDYISKITQPENTILLLDAFDENISAQKNYFKTLKNILLKVSEFRIVVMTCRTQFFPSQQEEPHETGYFTAGEKGEFHFQKLYISVFDNRDVKKYLKNRFPFIWQRRSYLKAKSIAYKCPNLVIRPMLLNHINDLLRQDKVYEFSFQIYDELINSWIRREANKNGIKEKYQTEMRFIRLLKKFSEKLAIDLYLNREKRGGYFMPKNEQFSEGILTFDALDEFQEESLDENDSRARSLLTRNAIGDYKFSHKSILEHFLAKAIVNKQIPLESFDFFGMDMTNKFHEEMVVFKLRSLEGKFGYELQDFYKNNYQSLKDLNLNRISDIKFLMIKNFSSIQPIGLAIFKNLEELILVDNIEMKSVYNFYVKMYWYFRYLSQQIKLQKLPKDGKQKWINKFSEFEENALKSLRTHFESLGYEKMEELYEILDLRILDRKFHEKENYEDFEFSLETSEDLNGMIRANQVVGNVQRLQSVLPNCKIFF